MKNPSIILSSHLGKIEKLATSTCNGSYEKIREAITDAARVLSHEQNMPMNQAFEEVRNIHQEGIRQQKGNPSLNADNYPDMLDGSFNQASQEYRDDNPENFECISETALGYELPVNTDIPKPRHGF